MYSDLNKTPLAIKLWLLESVVFVLLVPVIGKIGYVFYLFNIILAISYQKLSLSKSTSAIILIVKMLILVFLGLLHSSDSEFLVTVFAIVLADLSMLLLLSRISHIDFFDRKAQSSFLRMIFFTITVGFIFSVIYSKFLNVSNPLDVLSSGGRLKLLAGVESGHSYLIDLCFLGLLICMSGLSGHKSLARFIFTLIFLTLLVLSRAATSWAIILSLFYFYSIEGILKISLYKRLSIYFLTVFLALAFVVSGGQEKMMIFLRHDLQGNDLSLYGDDYSAGRDGLNKLLIEEASKSPFIGFGNSDKVLSEGTASTGDQFSGAVTESSFRIAVKFGFVYLIVIAIIFILPLRNILNKSWRVRFFSLSFSAGIFILMSSNSIFEVASTWQYFLYLPVALVISKESGIQRK